jgi:hypothetical protein
MERNRANDPAVYIPGKTIGHHGGGGSATIWAEVIVNLLNADAEATPPTTGVSAYIMRLTSDAIANWVSGTIYAKDAKAKDSTSGRAYKSKQDANTGHALTETGWWEILPEISPLPLGHIGTACPDMRKYMPRYLVGAIVELKKQTISGTDYYYLPGMTYIGATNSLATFDTGADGLARAGAVYAG